MSEELKPCPFCGETPDLPSGDGTYYVIECRECGGAVVGIQISDLMTIEERQSDPFTDYRYAEQFIERAKAKAAERWNTRATPPAAQDWHASAIEAGVADAEAGNLTPLEDVKAKWSTPPSAQVQGEREAFEDYAKSKGWDGHHLKRAAGNPERYDDWDVQPKWLAFKAGAAWRAALSAPPAAGVPDTLKTMRYHAHKIWCRVEHGTEEYEAGRTGLGCMEDAAESALYLRNKLDEMLAAAPTPPASEQQQAVVLSAAAADVMTERRRQVEKEGWSTEHDEEHDAGILAAGAAAYALNAADQLHPLSQGKNGNAQPACWPWAHAYWKPGVPRRDLVKAGALILAEIERWDRMVSHLAGVKQGATEVGNGGDA